jgi:hypothetical protein
VLVPNNLFIIGSFIAWQFVWPEGWNLFKDGDNNIITLLPLEIYYTKIAKALFMYLLYLSLDF